MNNNISNNLKLHYEECFKKFGATSEGIDWGNDINKLFLRYDKMLELFINDKSDKKSLLDVGCGYAGFYDYIKSKEINIDYNGIDIVQEMIEYAQAKNTTIKELIHDDFLDFNFNKTYDYIICNGVLTQKLETSNIDMDIYANKLIKKMYQLSNKGIAFNIMTTKVNFFSNNLYYRNPSELMAYCMSEITNKIKIDHTYLYEYTVYLYK